jgi:glucokinase
MRGGTVTTAVGLDVGGTKIAVGRVRIADGAVLAHEQIPTGADRPARVVLQDCVDLVGRLGRPQDVAVGIGVCELVSLDGRITSDETLAWSGIDIPGAFAGPAPAFVESDVRAGALAEARYGAGRDASSFLYVSVGTGVSCAFVLDGRPWPGARGNAIIVGGRRLEQTWSGGGLTHLLDRMDLSGALAEPDVRRVVAKAARHLGSVIGVLVNALDPALVVIGGGLGSNEDYREWLTEGLREDLYSPATRALPVVPAGLGARAGVVGAARYAVEASV